MNLFGTEIIVYRVGKPSPEKVEKYFTPLTDEATKSVLQSGMIEKVPASFARQLERKLNALTLENKDLLDRLGLTPDQPTAG